MPPHPSAPELLTLHALRIKGVAEPAAVARRFTLDRDQVDELLLDFEAYGWAYRAEFAGTGGWTLTGNGKAEDERQLATELADCGGRGAVTRVHAAFGPLNAHFQETVTRWQVRPMPGDDLARNDHTDHRWDDRVVDALAVLGRRLVPLDTALGDVLARFTGYAQRYSAAIERVERGEHGWVDGIGIDSCHTVWFELHEDLLATLGIERGHEG